MLKKVLWALCIMSLCAFCGCGDDNNNTEKQNDSSSGNNNTNSGKCLCEDSACANCTKTISSCVDETHITIETKIDGYDGNNHIVKNDSNSKQCIGGTCKPDDETGAHCENNSNEDGDKCICEDMDCKNCAVVKTVCVNGMSIGRLDVYTEIDGYMPSGGHITDSNMVGTDCKKKCVQDTETTAHCIEDEE